MKLEISGHAGHPTPSGTPTMWYPVAQDSHNVCVASLITLIIKLYTKIMFKVNHHHHDHQITFQYLVIDTNLEMALTDEYLARMGVWEQTWVETQVLSSHLTSSIATRPSCLTRPPLP